MRNVTTGSSFKHPTVADVEDGFILRRDKIFDVMMDQVNEETTSNLIKYACFGPRKRKSSI